MESIAGKIYRLTKALAGPTLIVVLIFSILRRAIFSSGHLVPVWPNADLSMAFIPWRNFGFSQWKHGHFPFWNPRVFCGIPFFAQIQTCLLYPIAWINFLANASTATTLEMATNLCIGAICMYAWARQRQISRCGSTLAAALYTFSGPFYDHVVVGYLTVLASLAWMPLIFLALDRLLEERFGSAILIGAAAICLQCLGGHAQLVYYTFLVGGIYLVLHSIGRSRPIRFYGGFIAIYCLGGMLAAVQLLPTYFATTLSVRAGGISYAWASMVSLPPENLLSIFIPYPLGNMLTLPYLGRWYLWETTLYIGIVGLVLACIGIAGLTRPNRWRMITILAATLILALGAYTPVHRLLYEYLPGFNLFRGASKFGALWTLLLSLLAGYGWDQIRRGQVPRRAILLTFSAAALSALLASIVYQFNSPNGPVAQLLQFVAHSAQSYIPNLAFQNPRIQQTEINWMSEQWYIAAGLLAATCLLLYLRRFSIETAYVLLALAIGNIYVVAIDCSPINLLQNTLPAQWTEPTIRAEQQDQRLLFDDLPYQNSGENLGYNGIWGYDTGQPKRYTDLVAASQGAHPAASDQYNFNFQRVSRIFQLLRCRDILQSPVTRPVIPRPDPMPHLQLLGSYLRMTDPAAISRTLLNDFDFHHSAILETDPNPAPTLAGATGRAVLLRQSINDLEIQADVPAPALLLITDAFAPGWHARPMETTPPQTTYNVLEADDVLRAIPLSPGHHHIDLYYIPPGLYAGIGISAIGWALWLTGIMIKSRAMLRATPRRSRGITPNPLTPPFLFIVQRSLFR